MKLYWFMFVFSGMRNCQPSCIQYNSKNLPYSMSYLQNYFYYIVVYHYVYNNTADIFIRFMFSVCLLILR